MRLMTLVWGIGLTAETALRSWMALTWPIGRFLVVSPFIGYGIYGGLALWTLWYRKTLSDRGAAKVPPGAVG
jgi:hypothetical protein